MNGNTLERFWKRNSIIFPDWIFNFKSLLNLTKEETRSDRVTHLSKYLSDFIVEDSNEPYGERILRDHYNKIIKNSNEKISIILFTVFLITTFFSCNPESLADEAVPQMCSGEGTEVPPPPPTPPTGSGG